MQKGMANERIIFAIINTKNIFYSESPNKAISAGGTYSTVNPTIPGRWRISGRVGLADGSKNYYTQDVYNQDFVFISPVSGTLEALAIYLYDRTSATPANIKTPMDIYKEINNTCPTPICGFTINVV